VESLKNNYFIKVSQLVLGIYFLVLLKLVVFKGSLSDLQQHFTGEGTSPIKPQQHNLLPFHTLYYYISMQEPFDVAVRNILGNMILFIPYALLLPFAFYSLGSFKRNLLAVFLTSLFFELLQLVTKLGSFDVDDILLNMLGGIAGWLLYRALVLLLRAQPGRSY